MDKGYKRPTQRSRDLRNNAIPAERLLWTHLSARKIGGVRFNRQFPIGSFICDFASRSAKLVVEVDGGQHAIDVATDQARTAYLETRGYRVIRFWNNEVLESIDWVVQEIERALTEQALPRPLPQAGGEIQARTCSSRPRT